MKACRDCEVIAPLILNNAMKWQMKRWIEVAKENTYNVKHITTKDDMQKEIQYKLKTKEIANIVA